MGTLYLGRIYSRVLRPGDLVWALDFEGRRRSLAKKHLERVEKPAPGPGEIIRISFIKYRGVNVTLTILKDGLKVTQSPVQYVYYSQFLSPPYSSL